MADGPPPETRQLSQRPTECPLCKHPVDDRFTWEDSDTLWVDVGCGNCEWYAHLLLTPEDPDGE